MVWARYSASLYWPGVVADPRKDYVPPRLPHGPGRPPRNALAVIYFGDDSWQWVTPERCVDFEAHYEEHANAPALQGRPGFRAALAEADDMLQRKQQRALARQRGVAAGAGDPPAVAAACAAAAPGAPGAALAPSTSAAQVPTPSAPQFPQPQPPQPQQQQQQQPAPAVAAGGAASSSGASPPEPAVCEDAAMLALQLKRKRADMERLAAEAANHEAVAAMHKAEAAKHAAEGECIDLEIKLARRLA
jgi:hypothetical protein